MINNFNIKYSHFSFAFLYIFLRFWFNFFLHVDDRSSRSCNAYDKITNLKSSILNKISPIRIGIDLDNTIISYDRAFQIGAKLSGLVEKDCKLNKKGIRDLIRKRQNGESEWQKLQGYVYSEGINEAALFPGVFRFLWLCKERKIRGYSKLKKKELVSLLSEKREKGPEKMRPTSPLLKRIQNLI